MTDHITQKQAIATVPGLSQERLASFLKADLVMPALSSNGPMFRPFDLARLELLCELADHFDLEADALGVVIGLIDQLHTARFRLRAMAQAMEPEPQDFRLRVGARFVGFLSD
jgi:chaperone modulatory protein CbpM